MKELSIFISHPSDFLTDCQPNGDGLIAYGFISRLAERGHTLHIAVNESELAGPLPDNVRFYPIKTRFRGLVTGRLEYMLKSRLLLNRLRRTERIDLIHQMNPVNKGLSLSMIGAGLPVVLGQFYPDWPADAETPVEKLGWWRRMKLHAKEMLRRQVLNLQQRFAAVLIVSSRAALERIYQPERASEKIAILPPGVDTTHFSPGEEPALASEPNILFLANLWRRKGIFTLLDAFQIVHRAMPNCRLTIVGSAGLEAEVHRRADALSARPQITFIRQVSRAEMPAMVRKATVYCLPSYGEPLGNSAIEVMACGKPIVGTNAGGLGELIQDGGGRKVPPRDANALAAALLEILASPELQTQMGKFNRDLIQREFAWDRVMEQLETAYQRGLRTQSVTVAASAKMPGIPNF